MGELEAESELKETIRTRVKDLETASRELAGVVTTSGMYFQHFLLNSWPNKLKIFR